MIIIFITDNQPERLNALVGVGVYFQVIPSFVEVKKSWQFGTNSCQTVLHVSFFGMK